MDAFTANKLRDGMAHIVAQFPPGTSVTVAFVLPGDDQAQCASTLTDAQTIGSLLENVGKHLQEQAKKQMTNGGLILP